MPINRLRRVLMVGPALAQRGGIAAVERAYLGAWDFDRYELRHVASYASHHGARAAKLWSAVRALTGVAWQLVAWRPDILHVHISQRGSFYRKSVVLVLAKAFRVHAVILHAHGSDLHTIYAASGRLRRGWIRSVLRSANRIVVLGPWWRRFYASLAPLTPIDILPNPVIYPEEITPYRERPAVVLTLGELGARKGTYDTLRAIPAILEQHPGTEFWFAGDGDLGPVESMVAKEPWAKQVRLLGWVEGQAKDEVLAKARVFLLPSYSEGLPVAVLEAMAHGMPVVTTPVGDIPEAVTDGRTGFLILPGDVESIAHRVSQLLRDGALAERVGAQARSHACNTYSVRAIMPRLYRIYDLAVLRRAV